jgi:hypothetical protein
MIRVKYRDFFLPHVYVVKWRLHRYPHELVADSTERMLHYFIILIYIYI